MVKPSHLLATLIWFRLTVVTIDAVTYKSVCKGMEWGLLSSEMILLKHCVDSGQNPTLFTKESFFVYKIKHPTLSPTSNIANLQAYNGVYDI